MSNEFKKDIDDLILRVEDNKWSITCLIIGFVIILITLFYMTYKISDTQGKENRYLKEQIISMQEQLDESQEDNLKDKIEELIRLENRVIELMGGNDD